MKIIIIFTILLLLISLYYIIKIINNITLSLSNLLKDLYNNCIKDRHSNVRIKLFIKSKIICWLMILITSVVLLNIIQYILELLQLIIN